MQKHQGFSALVIIILLAILAGGGYWVWKNQTITPPSALPEVEGTFTSPLGGGSEGVEGWKTYRNDEYGFEFKYPSSYSVKTENNNKNIIVFASNFLTFGVFVEVEQKDLNINEYNFHFNFSGNGQLFKKILSTFRFTK